jgi:hypothetical protein
MTGASHFASDIPFVLHSGHVGHRDSNRCARSRTYSALSYCASIVRRHRILDALSTADLARAGASEDPAMPVLREQADQKRLFP